MSIYTNRRPCYFCRKKIDYIDFKDIATLKRYLTNWSKIKPAQNTGLCAKHQRRLAQAIKRSRFLALIPYVNT